MPAGIFSKSAIGTRVMVAIPVSRRDDGYVPIDGLQNVQIQSPEVTTSSVAVLEGGGVTRAGSVLPETLTADRIANYATQVQDVLFDARRNGKELSFRIQTGAPTDVVPTVATDMAAIATTGIVTFTPASGNTRNTTLAALASSQIAVGHYIVMGARQFRIISIAGTPDVVTVQDAATKAAPASSVSAGTYEIINPRLRIDANAHVTQTGSFSASTDGNPIGDSFSLAFINNLPDWTPLFT